MIILVELRAVVDDSGAKRSFYLSTGNFTTGPDDFPANTSFLPRLKDAGSISLSAYGSNRTSGGTVLDKGTIELVNVDGALDDWLSYGFDGQPVTIRVGEKGAAYPLGFKTVLTGTIAGVEGRFKALYLRLRDMQYVLETPACTSIYAGDNALPEGVEGTAADLKGQRKPRLFGKVFEIEPPLVNTSKLTYQVNDGAVQSIDAVYDQGEALTPGDDFDTVADLHDEVVAEGTYITCKALGYFRLGSAPVGQITADVTQGAAAANRTTAQILAALALDAGVVSDLEDGGIILLGEDGEILLGEDGEVLLGAGYTTGTLTTADVAALDNVAPAEVGVWITGDETYAEAMDRVAASVGAFYGFDGLGRFRVGRLTAPAGTPRLVLGPDQFQSDLERKPPRDNALPVWAVTVQHTLVHTVQRANLAGAVSAERRAYLANAYRSARVESAATQVRHALAGEISVETLLTSATDATTEATRLLGLYSANRAIYEVPVAIDILPDDPLAFMDIVRLDHERFDLSGGKPFRLIGIRLELASRKAILSLWG